MDNLDYHYIQGTNKLTHVTDAVGDGVYDNDIDSQDPNNYTYDLIGNLVNDTQEGMAIRWNAYGKIAEVWPQEAQTGETQKPHIKYTYGADGNRVKKWVNSDPYGTSDPQDIEVTYYVRDASGNIMSVYTENATVVSGVGHNHTLKQTEVPVYGSDRLGIYRPALSSNLFSETVLSSGEFEGFDLGNLTNHANATEILAMRTVGMRNYELKDHLGNVRVVISDRKTSIDHSEDVEVLSANNYYPFGMLHSLQSNSWNSGGYRFGFNGKEMDNDMGGSTGAIYDYGFRIYDARIAKFLSVDPLTKEYPELTPYQFASNTPIWAIDLDGLEAFFVHGMRSSKEDWDTDGFIKVQKSLIKLTNNKWLSDKFDWSGYGNGVLQSKRDRTKAASELVNFVLENKVEGEEITLIGVSHGGNVAIQAAKILGEKGYKANVITLNSPAYSGEDDPEDPRNNEGINDMIIIRTKDDPISPIAPGGAEWKYDGKAARQELEITNEEEGGAKHSTASTDVNQIDNSSLEKLKPVPKENTP